MRYFTRAYVTSYDYEKYRRVVLTLRRPRTAGSRTNQKMRGTNMKKIVQFCAL